MSPRTKLSQLVADLSTLRNVGRIAGGPKLNLGSLHETAVAIFEPCE